MTPPFTSVFVANPKDLTKKPGKRSQYLSEACKFYHLLNFLYSHNRKQFLSSIKIDWCHTNTSSPHIFYWYELLRLFRINQLLRLRQGSLVHSAVLENSTLTGHFDITHFLSDATWRCFPLIFYKYFLVKNSNDLFSPWI